MLHKKRTNFSKRVMGNKKNVPTEVNTLTVTVYIKAYMFKFLKINNIITSTCTN